MSIQNEIIDKCIQSMFISYPDVVDKYKESNIDIKINNRLKRKNGLVKYRYIFNKNGHNIGLKILCIELNKRIFNDEMQLVKTVTHELSHVVQLLLYNYSDHGELFNEIFQNINKESKQIK